MTTATVAEVSTSDNRSDPLIVWDLQMKLEARHVAYAAAGIVATAILWWLVHDFMDRNFSSK